MNIPNPNWPRWIFASTADYFKEVEFRINGPAVTELSRSFIPL